MLAADFDKSQRGRQEAAGVPAARRGRGMAERGRWPGGNRRTAGVSTSGWPRFCATRCHTRWPPSGRTGSPSGGPCCWPRETACLSLADRRQVDESLAADVERLEAMGDGELAAAARKPAYELDAEAVVARRRRAEADRSVTLRPTPDVMSHLSALLYVAQGVSVYAALKTQADSLIASGDVRGRGQIMADTRGESHRPSRDGHVRRGRPRGLRPGPPRRQ